MRSRVVATLSTACALVGGAVVSPAVADAAPRRLTLAASAPTWLSRAHRVGPTPGSAPVDVRVYLAPTGGAANLAAAVARVSTPGSSSYRHFISAAQFHATYDPSPAAVSAVSTWLTSAGLTVTSQADHNSYLSVSGTVAAAQSAFGVSISTYTHDGQTVQANSTALSLPVNLAAAVSAVSGLDTTTYAMKAAGVVSGSPPPRRWAPTTPPAAYASGTPCSTYYGQSTPPPNYLPSFMNRTIPYAVCGYKGTQLRAAYGATSSGEDGTGVTVAITGAYNNPTMQADANQYASRNGDGSYASGQYFTAEPNFYRRISVCGPSGWFGEQSLDVEAVHAMAPKANIRYYASPSCFNDDFTDTLSRAVNDNLAQVVTSSWGSVEQNATADTVTAYEQIFQQGALQGISFLFSSGDSGDEQAYSGTRQPDFPASDQYVTAVGGTSTAIGPNNQVLFTTGWGTNGYNLSYNGSSPSWNLVGFYAGAGGGYSTKFPRPAYQTSVVPSSTSGRAVPDVAMDADPTTGMLIGLTQLYPDNSRAYGEFRVGGTSLAAPLFAGETALRIQHAGGGLGALNPSIYARSGTASFTDVAGTPNDPGNVVASFVNQLNSSAGVGYGVSAFDNDSSLSIATGWDPVTGVGTPTSSWITSTGSG